MNFRASTYRSIVFQSNSVGGRLKYYAEEADQGFWDELWERVVDTTNYSRYEMGHMPHQLRRTFLRWVPKGSKVLEAGCGLATFTVAAQSLGFNAEGIDYAPKVIEEVRKRYPHINFFVGDVRCMSEVPDRTYGAIYSPGVCEHFEEGPEAVLREAHRVLNSNGILLVSTPCFNALQKLLRHFGRFNGDSGEGRFYQYAFSPQELRGILEEIGFDVIQTHQYGTLLSFSENFPRIDALIPPKLVNPIAFALDSIPGVRRIGHGCIWVARKRS